LRWEQSRNTPVSKRELKRERIGVFLVVILLKEGRTVLIMSFIGFAYSIPRPLRILCLDSF
jgi:hypothetical protein